MGSHISASQTHESPVECHRAVRLPFSFLDRNTQVPGWPPGSSPLRRCSASWNASERAASTSFCLDAALIGGAGSALFDPESCPIRPGGLQPPAGLLALQWGCRPVLEG